MTADKSRGAERPDAFAPVAVFAYKRRDHLRATMESLLSNVEARQTHVRIYCDAARTRRDEAGVAAVRRYVESIRGFASVTPVFRETNWGLARSIVDGVTEMLSAHDRVIVLEDDLVVSRHFLGFMNDSLDLYRDDSRVASIHGYCYPTREPLPETFFLAGADCWGWGTWSRAWRTFRHDGEALLREMRARKLERHFDYNGQYPYTRMLQDRVAGHNNSWAICWHASCYLQGLLTLYPGRSLVDNIGNDASGTHGSSTDAFVQAVSDVRVRPSVETPVQPSSQAHAQFERFFREHTPFAVRARRWLSGVVRKSA